jgi:hypothetical protein
MTLFGGPVTKVSRVCVHCLGGEDLVADDDAGGRVDGAARERGHVVDRGGRMGVQGPDVDEDARETLQHRLSRADPAEGSAG